MMFDRMMFDRRIRDYIGDIAQIGGIKRYQLASGKGKGVEAFDVRNGNGLEFTVVADRGLDISHLSYKGFPLSFISKTGTVSPYFFNGQDYEWLRSFTGGFLTTCGLTQVGEPCVYEDRKYGLHGLYSNTPAEYVSVFSNWMGDSYTMKISGRTRQAMVQFENIVLERTITAVLGKDELLVEDEIINEGYRREPFMILYHMNFGYPFLNDECDIVIPTRSISGWDEYSHKNTSRHLEITGPDADAPELTWYHDVHCDTDGFTEFFIADKKRDPDIAVAVKYNRNVLGNLTQWMNLRPGDYVMALEPCNNLVKGVASEAANGSLRYLEPGQRVKIRLDIRFLSGREAISEARAGVESLMG